MLVDEIDALPTIQGELRDGSNLVLAFIEALIGVLDHETQRELRQLRRCVMDSKRNPAIVDLYVTMIPGIL